MVEVATEVAGQRVTANSIHPGEVQTEMWADITDKAHRAGHAGGSLAEWSANCGQDGRGPCNTRR